MNKTNKTLLCAFLVLIGMGVSNKVEAVRLFATKDKRGIFGHRDHKPVFCQCGKSRCKCGKPANHRQWRRASLRNACFCSHSGCGHCNCTKRHICDAKTCTCPTHNCDVCKKKQEDAKKKKEAEKAKKEKAKEIADKDAKIADRKKTIDELRRRIKNLKETIKKMKPKKSIWRRSSEDSYDKKFREEEIKNIQGEMKWIEDTVLKLYGDIGRETIERNEKKYE